MLTLDTDQINEAKNLIDQASNILIAIPSNPSYDSIAASLTLYLALLSKGKRVNCACSDKMTVEFSWLVGLDKISTNLANNVGKYLTISFPYKEGSIEKVSYNIENDNFNLVVETKEGFEKLTPEKINYSYSNGETDLIILVNTSKLDDLGSIYNNSKELFNNTPVINISSQGNNSNFGRVNIVKEDISSATEISLYFLNQLEINLDPDIATNLLAGLFYSTDNFTSEKTTASTFEAAAICLNNGAKKQFLTTQKTSGFKSDNQMKRPIQTKPTPFIKSQNIPFQPKKQTATFLKSTQKTDEEKRGQEQEPSEKKADTKTEVKTDKQTSAPSDWLKPKIFKGSTLL